jgi:hypothetical protein
MIPFTPDDRRAQFAPSQNVGGAVDRDVLDIIGAQPQQTMAGQVDYDVPDIKPVDPDVVDIVNQSQVPLMSSLMGASRVNPDQAAEANRIGSQIGVGQDIALRNMDEVRQRAFMAEVQRRDIARANPVLAGFLTDRTFANEASDDIGTLDRVGSFFADIGRAAAGRPMEYTAGELVRGYMRGQLVAERGEIGTRAILGEAEETNFARAKQIQQEMRDLTGGGILASTAEVVAQNVAQAREVVGAGLIGGAAGSVVPGIGTMTGFAGGLGTGIVLTTAKMEAGNLYLDLQEQGISDDTAVPIAVGAGLLNGVVEAVGMKIAAAPFRQLASRVMREQIAEAVRKPTMRSALAEAGKAYVVQVGSEAAEEGLQEIVNIAGEELAKGMEGIDSETTMRDAAKRVLDSFVQGAMGGAILGGVGPGANLYVDLRRAGKATKQTQFFNDLSQNATESKLKARDPGAYERFVAATAAGTNAETVFVDGATMRDVLTQAGVTDAQLEAIVPGVAQQVRQAAELGNDVTLPTAQFAGRLAGTPLGDALLPHMRLSPDAMSAMEAQQFAQSREALVEEARALLEAKTEAESAFVQEADQVFSSMRERLVAAGRDPALADIEALMHQAFVVTQAANRGMTPAQFEAESGLREIVGAEMPAAPLEQANRDLIASVDAELGRVMDAAKEASRAAGKPKSKDIQAAAKKAKQQWIAANPARYEEYQASQRMDALENERVREAAASALAGKIDDSLATAEKTLTDAGFVLDYESPAPSKSRYYRKGNALIRLSDHEIPVTPERAAAREAGVQVPYRDFVFDGTAVDAELIQDLEEFAARTSPNIMEQASRLDADYMAAVESGDMEAAQRMVDEAASQASWPIHFQDYGYHYTANEFTVFDNAAAREKNFQQLLQYYKDVDTALSNGQPMPEVPPKTPGWTTEYGRGYAFPKNAHFFFLGKHPPDTLVQTIGKKRLRTHLFANRVLDLTKPLSGAEFSSIADWMKTTFEKPATGGNAAITVRGKMVGGLRKARKEGVTQQQLFDFFAEHGFRDRGVMWHDMMRSLGYDAIMFDGNSSGTSMLEPRRGVGDGQTYTVVAVLDPNQIKLADPVTYDEAGNVVPLSRRFDITSPRIFEQAAVPALLDVQHREAIKAGDIATAQALTDAAAESRMPDSKVRDEAGKIMRVFHGTQRIDRVGNRLLKKRATSGPMPFFTNTRPIAEGYAQGKQDTSIEDIGYEQWIKYTPKGQRSKVTLDQAWFYLTPEQKATATERLFTTGYENPNEGTGAIVGNTDTIASRSHVEYMLREARGNALTAAKELWLNSGSLFNDEQQFMDVLKGMGLTERFVYDSPHAVNSGIIEAYLNITNPLDTAAIPESVVEALQQRANRIRKPTPQYGRDHWDKEVREPKAWMQTLRNDMREGRTQAWTSIPDWVTDVLRRLGYDGIKDTGGKFGGEQHTVWIPFEPEQVKFADAIAKDASGRLIPLSERFDVTSPMMYLQAMPGRGPARGGYDPSRLKILFGKGADFTTGAHELTHYYVDYYTKQAMAGTAAPQMLADLDAMFKFMGVAGDTPEARLAAFNAMPFETARPLIEAITYNAEVYLFEGKAPSLELAGVFDRMLAFFRRAYKSLADFVTQQQEIYRREFGRELPALNDDLRAVFDRMLADERQIKQAQAVAQMRGQFTVKPEGMEDAEWAAYQEMAGEATNAAIADMTKASLRQMEWLSRARNRIVKDLQARHTAQRKEVRERVQKDVQQEPLYRAMAFLRRGQVVAPDGTVTEAEGVHRIDQVLAAEFAPTVDLAALGGRFGVLQDDGLHPDIVAEMFGYPTGGTLLEALAAAKPMREVVEDRTDAEMLRLYGEMNTPEAREQEIQKALHNEARARLVGVELRFMGKIQQPVRVLMEAARQAAQQVIDRKRVGELRPSEFVAAEAKASREATAAMQDNKPDVAVRAKRAQLLNNQLAKAALEVKDEIDTDIRYLRRVLRDSNRQRMGADVADQIAKLLSRVNIAPMTLAESRRIGTLAKFLALLEARGIVPDIAEAIGMTDDSIPYKNMTIGEFRDLVDAVKQLEYVGKNERKILIAKEKAEFETVRDEIVKSVVENAGDRKDNARTATTNIGRAVTAIKGFAAAHLKAASIVRILDGGKDGGPLWNYLIRSANEAGDTETSMRAEATADLTKILEPAFRAGKLGGKGVFFPSINRSLNREARLVVALNMGNAGNMQRLLDGEGWSMEAVMPVLQSLTEDELNTVQQIWDYFEKYRPMIGQKERRLYGKEPSWVEPQPLVVRSADGKTVTLRGGYYPIKYDPRASRRAETMSLADEAKRDLAGAYTTATTRRSFVKARASEGNIGPLLYTLAGMYGGINDVIHDLTWHEWLIQANRLMRSNSFDDAVRNRYGPEYVTQLKNWIKDVAAGERGVQNEAEMALNFLRQGISSAGLGFNIVSAAMQITGFNQSIVRVGARWIGRGIAYVAQNPMVAMREVNEKSEFMRNRSRTQFRELNEIRNMVQGQSVAMRRVQMGTYFLMMRMQRMVDVPTWHGAYEKAMYEGRDEETAIALADQAVIDSQGGGMVKDLARVERGGPAVKLFTVFYGYMNTVYNMAAVQTMTNKNKGKLAADYAMLFVVPVVLSYMLKQALIPRKGDEEEEWDMGKIGRELAAEQLSYLMGTMVIAREFGEVGKMIFGVEGPRMGYGGPAGLRAIGETYQFATQASQGEFDTAFRKSAVNMIGAFTGLPSAQVNRTLDGLEALYEGETKNVLAPLTGAKKR